MTDALHLLPLDDDAANDAMYEYEEYCLDGEPGSSLVAGLRTGGDPDVHPEEQTMPRRLWFAYLRYFVVDSVACLQHKNHVDDTIRHEKKNREEVLMIFKAVFNISHIIHVLPAF